MSEPKHAKAVPLTASELEHYFFLHFRRCMDIAEELIALDKLAVSEKSEYLKTDKGGK